MTPPLNLPLRTSTPVAAGRTFASASEAASHYVGLGFLPVPIPYRSKNPGVHGWEQLRIDATNVNAHFNGEAKNIGALLGISSLGTLALTDVDLDSPEALRVSRALLPNTNFIFGRNSKPASHWCYFVDPPLRLQQFKDPGTKAMLVELRGTKKDGGIGLQTVLPGSVHETGEPIRFEAAHDSTPSQVEGEALVKAVQKVASAALLSRYWPTKGRHVCMLSLAGALARGQWASEDALLFCRTLYQSVPTHDPAALQRVDSEVNDSFAKVAGGEPATGFTALIEHIDKKVVEAALGWLGLKPTTQITVAGENWREQLLLTKEGNPKPQLQNIALMLRHAPEWQGVLAYNEFSGFVETKQPAPWPQARRCEVWTDDHVSRTCCWLQRQGIAVTPRQTCDACLMIAREHPFHPVKDYLGALVWDQTPRLDSWVHTHLGAEDSALNAALGAKWLIQAVARVMRPGCQADATLLLIGEQGLKKSSALRVLASPEYFTDSLTDLGSKDSKQELHSRWIVEMSEFTSRRSELERKGFLTARADYFRAPYERIPVQVLRSNVFAASSNDLTPLTDESGGRRYWSVTCGQIDIEKLQQDRDQLWAEACARYSAGEAWWDDFAEFRTALATEQEARYQGGTLDELILPWLENPVRRAQDNRMDRTPLRFDSDRERVTLLDVLVHACGKTQHEINQRDRMLARDCLRHVGWRSAGVTRVDTVRVMRFYVRPGVTL